MEFTNDQINQIMESEQFQEWEDSIKMLIDYIVDVMDKNVPESQQNLISEEIIINLFMCSLNLHDGIRK